MKFNKSITIAFIAALAFGACDGTKISFGQIVKDIEELNTALSDAEPGTTITMKNGKWEDVQIRFYGNGEEGRPIKLRAETAGEVKIQGLSNLRLGGKYLEVEGLHFENGYSPTNAVIQFALNNDTLAHHSRVTNCVVESFNKPQRNLTDLWVLFRGRHNQMDHCYIAGKSNRGPTVRVDLEGNESIKNYHKIEYNHFGPRPPKGGPSAETLQIGNSYTSMSPSYTLVANNLFEKCNGEVEIISSKANFNEFRGNVFYKSEGSLVTRHGNYCTVDGNYFIGDDDSEQYGGIRLIGTGHWITNNYFYRLKGKEFRSPLAVMNGIPKSPQNRYTQVTDAVVAYNSWIECESPLQFGVGTNIDQKDVLPASEIRSARPKRTLVANNLIYNSIMTGNTVIEHDKTDGVKFISNVINNEAKSAFEGIENVGFNLKKIEDNVLAPEGDLSAVEIYQGFEFESISKDLLGSERGSSNGVGAILSTSPSAPDILNYSKYGTSWYAPNVKDTGFSSEEVNSTESLIKAIQDATEGGVITLAEGIYKPSSSLKIDKSLTLKAKENVADPKIEYSGAAGTPAFEMNPGGELTLEGISIKGTGSQYAFAPLDKNMSSLYNLTLIDCDISNFDFILKSYKYSFSELISIKDCRLSKCANGLRLAEEDDNKGDYNAENIFIENTTFSNIDKNVINYYRGGYDESTVGGNLVLNNSLFENCGAKDQSGILINTYGIINVDISGNEFRNNRVEKIAQLWGAKNNKHSDNKTSNSGQIIVKENLELKLIY